MSVLPPQTLLHEGAFVIESVLGRGGFGITYRARDAQNERDVAIKECFPAGCERVGSQVVARDFWAHNNCAAFQNRVRAQATWLLRLSHPHLTRVLDCFDENGTVYLVMELVDGQNLLEILEEREVFLEEAQIWIEKLAGALGALHESGLLHLDVKPENIVLRENEPVLLDFDLVQPQNDADFSTRPLSLSLQCGTPGYAPLEQYAQTAKLSPAADIYALGATFYHLLARKAPLASIDRAAGTAFPTILELRPEVPAHLGEAISRALELQSDHRLASTRQFLDSLRPPEIMLPKDDDDGAFITLAPQQMRHGTGLHRIVLTTKTPTFARRCVCCYEKSDTIWPLVSPSGRHDLPLCGHCHRHQLAAKASGVVTFWGSLISLALALVVVGLSFVTSSLWPLLLGPICIVMNFAALSYGALKSSRAEEMLKSSCCDLSQPATYVFNGKVHIWRFRNALYAADFKRKNADFVV